MSLYAKTGRWMVDLIRSSHVHQGATLCCVTACRAVLQHAVPCRNMPCRVAASTKHLLRRCNMLYCAAACCTDRRASRIQLRLFDVLLHLKLASPSEDDNRAFHTDRPTSAESSLRVLFLLRCARACLYACMRVCACMRACLHACVRATRKTTLRNCANASTFPEQMWQG